MTMSPFTMKSRGLPSDLPLNDIAPPTEYIGTASSYWKIYRSKLISSQAEVSVFIFDKAACNKLKQKKAILNSVWRHVEMVQNIQKYSSVTLKILVTAKENRKYVAYATEPVVGSLSNVLGDFPSNISRTHAAVLNKMSLCEMEIKYGVVSIAETLSYLHLYETMIHCDVSPRNIVVCSNGSWRLSGFHFVVRVDAANPLELKHTPDRVTSDFLQPDINFAAPCMFLGEPTQESDVFSLGMLIAYVYNHGISLIESTAVASSIYDTDIQEIDQLYNKRISSAYNAIKSRIPQGLQRGLSKIINFDVETQPTAQQFLMLGYYQDPLIKYLKRINLYENLPESDRNVVLSSELPECAKNLPQSMLFSHVIPVVTLELAGYNHCAGTVHTLVVCLSRCLTSSNTEIVCNLMNKILDSGSAVNLSPEAHEMIMSHITVLYHKSKQTGSLLSPLPLVVSGLANTSKVLSSLSAITQLSSLPESGAIFTPATVTEVKSCFLAHWKEIRKELCTVYLTSMSVWISSVEASLLSEDICLWFVGLISHDLELLHDVKELLMTMLSRRETYKLSDEFVNKQLSAAVENLFALPHITHSQRQTLVTLARYTETICHALPSSMVIVESLKKADEMGNTKRRSAITRQAGTSVTPPELKTPPATLQQKFSLVVTEAEHNVDNQRTSIEKPESLFRSQSERYSGSVENGEERHRKLCQMDASSSRGSNTSFGDLMAAIDKSDVKKSPLLSKGARTSSLQVHSNPAKVRDVGLERRSSLQVEHYRKLNADNHTKISTPASTPQRINEEPNVPKVDNGLMRSILQRLDSLTHQFNIKTSSSSDGR